MSKEGREDIPLKYNCLSGLLNAWVGFGMAHSSLGRGSPEERNAEQKNRKGLGRNPDQRNLRLAQKSEPHRWVCLRLPVSGTQVFQLYSARKQLPAPPASFRGGSFGEVGTPGVSQNKREAGLGGGSPAHPRQIRSLSCKSSLLRQGVNHRADARSGSFPDAGRTKAHVFSWCENRMPSERVWDSRPGLGHVLRSAVLT